MIRGEKKIVNKRTIKKISLSFEEKPVFRAENLFEIGIEFFVKKNFMIMSFFRVFFILCGLSRSLSFVL